MEKILRRAILNRNQVVAKKRRVDNKELRKTWREFNRMRNLQSAEMGRLIREERVARREDWILGPLAPSRNVGTQKETYGSVQNVLTKGPDLPRRELRGPRGKGSDFHGSEDRRLTGSRDKDWRGEGLHGNLVEGDRVVVVKGRLGVQGRIGEVTRIDGPAQMVFVKGVNKVDLRVPAHAVVDMAGNKIIDQEMPIPIADLRLVIPIQDPVTGALKDAIVRQVVGGPPYNVRNDGSNLPRHTRYVKGSVGSDGKAVEIPWPKEEQDRFFSQSVDTESDWVDQITYFPAVNDPSDPLVSQGIIDELRNKHSRQRFDWDDATLMRTKLMEDARREWFKERSVLLSQPFWHKTFLSRSAEMKQKKLADAEGREARQAAEKEARRAEQRAESEAKREAEETQEAVRQAVRRKREARTRDRVVL